MFGCLGGGAGEFRVRAGLCGGFGADLCGGMTSGCWVVVVGLGFGGCFWFSCCLCLSGVGMI